MTAKRFKSPAPLVAALSLALTLPLSASARADAPASPAAAPEDLPAPDAPSTVPADLPLGPLPEGTELSAPTAIPLGPPPAQAPTPPEPRVITHLTPGASYTRTWHRSVALKTVVERRSRRTSIEDHSVDRLEATIVYQPQASRYLIEVTTSHHARGSISEPASELPPARARLFCEQSPIGAVACVDATSGQPVAWPDWAPLDLNPWMSSAGLQPNYRWRRSIDNAGLLGWHDTNSQTARMVLAVSNPVVDSDEQTAIAGTVTASAHLTVLATDLPYDISGTVTATFDQREALLDRVVIDLASHVEHQASSVNVPFRWERQMATRMTIETSAPGSKN